MKRLTPERETVLRAKKIYGIAAKIFAELWYEIDGLRMDILDLKSGNFEAFEEEFEEEYEHDDKHAPVYEKFQELNKERDKLRSVLTTKINNDAVKKFISKSEEK